MKERSVTNQTVEILETKSGFADARHTRRGLLRGDHRAMPSLDQESKLYITLSWKNLRMAINLP